MYYMSDEQQERVKKLEFSFPDEYELSDLDPDKDTEVMFKTWKHSGPGDMDMIR